MHIFSLAVIFVPIFRKDDTMALMKCPECELQVSDKAISCPHCGYPIQERPKTSKTSKTSKKINAVVFRMALSVLLKSKKRIIGMKTDAGKQRIVPIHSKIQDLVKKNYDFAISIGSDFLLNDKGQTHADRWKLTYDKYANRFAKVIEELELNPEHRPHDPRMTFITRIKKAGADPNAVKAIVGHKISDITESVYTVRDIEWLKKDLEKLT